MPQSSTRPTIDDARAALRSAFGYDQFRAGQEMAIESGDDRARILERQLSADILTDFWCRCRSQRNRWWSTKLFSRFCNPQIARTKIMSPLADAVCFIDCEQADSDVPEASRNVAEIESLRREIEKTHLATRRASEPVRHLGGRESAVDERSRKVACFQRIHLVFH